MSEPCEQWQNIPKDGSCDEWTYTDDWILVTYSWNDINHYWRDFAFWLDRPDTWVKQ